MTNAFQRPSRRRRPTINLTSLIDVMFLLVIFLTVSTTFRDQLAIDITLPQADSAAMTPMDQEAALVVSRDGAYFFKNRAVDEPALRTALQAWADGDQAGPIVLRADEGAAYGKVVRAMDIAREVGVVELVIPTQPLTAGAKGAE